MARSRNLLAAILLCGCVTITPGAMAAEPNPAHAIAMHGAPKYPSDFTHFDYVNPDAPKGGAIVNEATGTYDSFNPFILKGVPAAGIGLLYDSLMSSSADEAFTKYASLAESVILPEDRSWVAFNIHPKARWHDGESVKPEDVIWTFNTLREKGHPFYRAYYADVKVVEKTGPRQVTFRFPDGGNRELPLIVAEISILPKHYWEGRDFTKTTLEPPLGGGAYRIKDFEAGRSVSYERVKDYWGADIPVHKGQSNIDEIRYEYYRDREVATEAFKSGAFDLRAENSAKRWATSFDFPALTAGQVIKALIPHENPTGMQGFIFNTRKSFFVDPRVRQAIAHAWDFEWANKTIMYGAYTRTNSYFSNSELSSEGGLPAGEELEILEGFRGKIPEEVFTARYEAPKTDGSGNNRGNLRKALKLLREAGWRVADGKLVNDKGEALAFELHQRNIPVRQATVGPVNKKDLLMASTATDPLQKVILGFSTKAITTDVAERLDDDDAEVKFISGPIIYHIMDAFEAWQEDTKAAIEEEQRESLVYPGRVLYLKDHTFRAKGPAIVGMRVLGGRVHVGQRLMKLDGTPVGQIKSLRTRASEDVKEAMQGDEVAVAVQGPTVGRHIEELDEFYVDVPERHVKRLRKLDLSPIEEEILDDIVALHRKENHFWGR